MCLLLFVYLLHDSLNTANNKSISLLLSMLFGTVSKYNLKIVQHLITISSYLGKNNCCLYLQLHLLWLHIKMACRTLFNFTTLRKKILLTSSCGAYFNPTCLYCTSNASSRRNIYKTEEVKKFRFFVLQHYLDYLKSYNAILEKKFPGAMQVYRVFMDGMKDFFTDLKLYIKLVHNLNIAGKNLETFNVKEVELYEQMPKDMRRIAPLLILSILPLANYVLFPIAYYFPRHLLCRHFWNLQQKSEFSIILLRKRLVHNKPIFRHLQLQLPKLKENLLHKKWSEVLGLIGSGLQPQPQQILSCMDLFVNGPYHIMYISGNHVKLPNFYRFVRCANKCRDTKANVQSLRNLQAVSNSWERRFFIVRLYNLFVKGTRDFYADFKQYFKVKTSKNSLDRLTLNEIELLEKMPKDIRKITPFLVISLLPLVCYLLLPYAYLYPRQLLCRHFWNEQQRTEYDTIFLQKRLSCHSPIFKHLHLELTTLPETVLKKNWHEVLELLKNGKHLHPDQIVICKGLFMNRPYALMYLNKDHIKHLLKMHELHMGWFRRTRLGDRAIILQAMDQAIIREGGVEVLSTESLRNACLIRGLNPMNMKNDDMINWLKRWIAVSCEIDKNSLSLLLHCPVLLGYNEPTNWQLIYFTKRT